MGLGMETPTPAFLIDPEHRPIAEGKRKLLPLFGAAGILKVIRLAREGRVVPGEVVFCSGTRRDDGSLVVNMKYRFQAPDGRTLESVERFSGARLPGEMLPAPHTAVAVYFAAEDCYTVL